MYNQAQRFVATVLFFCILLQSCGTNNFNLDQAHRQAIDAQVDNKKQETSDPKRRSQAVTQASSTDEALVRAAPLPAEALRAPDADTPTNSLAQQPSSPGSGSSSPKVVPKPHQAAGGSPRHAQRIGRPSIQRKDHKEIRAASQQPNRSNALVAPVAKEAQGLPAAQEVVAQGAQEARGVPTPLPFIASGGQQVVFKQVDGKWQATVTRRIGNFDLVEELPVLCQGNGDVQQALEALQAQDKLLHKYWVHVLPATPAHPALVYLGRLGLLGGAQFFQLDTSQLTKDGGLISMTLTHTVLRTLVAPADYDAICQKTTTVFNLLQESVTSATLVSHLRAILPIVRPVTLIMGAAPVYLQEVDRLPDDQKAEMIGSIVARFLLPTGRITSGTVRLCKESCLALLDAASQVADQVPTSNQPKVRELAQKECTSLLQETREDVDGGAVSSLPAQEEDIRLNTIVYKRDKATNLSTTGPFSIKGTQIAGFFLEPPGPSTTTPDLNRRIPAGKYNLMLNYGEKEGLRLYNDQVSENRAILIHSGNGPGDTKGCLLPGRKRSDNWVAPSKPLLTEIMDWFKEVGPLSASMLIYDP